MMGAVSGVMRAIEGNQKLIISKFLSYRNHKNLKIRHKNLKHFLDSSSEKVDTRLKFSPDQSEVLSINSL